MTWRDEMGALHTSLQSQLQSAHADAMVEAYQARLAIADAWGEQVDALDTAAAAHVEEIE